MNQERGDSPLPLTSIHIDLNERSLTLTAGNRSTRLTLTPGGILYQLLQGAAITERSVEKLLGEVVAEENDATSSEKEPTVTLSGKLKSKPRQGRADGQGNPTAWARFAAHEPETQDAHFYLATFHRHTAEIALKLLPDAALTVQGFPHPSRQKDRLDTLSVVNIVRYPGKPNRSPQ
jgi:hypothetical protein